jgi:hypothetical protein
MSNRVHLGCNFEAKPPIHEAKKAEQYCLSALQSESLSISALVGYEKFLGDCAGTEVMMELLVSYLYQISAPNRRCLLTGIIITE